MRLVAEPAKSLTPKQQRFVDEYLIDLNATQAAIRAGYSAKTAASIASENLTKPEIASAIQARQAKVSAAADFTLEQHLRALNALRDQAVSSEQFGPAVTAEVSRGKAAGFYVEKREYSGKGGGPLMVQIVREGRRRTA